MKIGGRAVHGQLNSGRKALRLVHATVPTAVITALPAAVVAQVAVATVRVAMACVIPCYQSKRLLKTTTRRRGRP